jgi:hypothetical protein
MIPLLLVAATLAVSCPRSTPASRVEPKHFVYFVREHDHIADPAFLAHEGIAGAQLMFTWRELEPERDRYDFTALRARLEFLERHGKRLWIQLQDVSFNERVFVPEYLLTDSAFHGGAARKYEGEPGRERFDGWVARRWDPAVRARHAKLLEALAREFDGRLEGINLPETATSFDDPARRPADFTEEAYAKGIRDMVTAARRAFTRSCVVVYANFMPGEWLPGNDKGYLKSVYATAARVGAGVGGPDLLPHRRGQQNHMQALVAGRPAGIIAAVAVQDGNLAEQDPANGARVTVEQLHRFAVQRLRLDYVFWGIEEPYYSSEILPHLRTLPRR